MNDTTKQTAEAAYLKAYRDAMQALQELENKIHAMPAPEGETEINWGHVGDMRHITSKLRELTSNE